MTIQRMDHVSVVVDDLEAAIAFFVELGMELEGEAPIEGRSVDSLNGLDGVRVDIAMMRANRFSRVSDFREDVIQYSAFWRYEGASPEKYVQAAVSALKIRVSAEVSFARSRCS